MKKTLNRRKNDENWQETLKIMRDPELARGIREGLRDIKAGRICSREEVFNKAQKKPRRSEQEEPPRAAFALKMVEKNLE